MDTRDQILSAATTVFAQHGFRGSTTRRIADAAGVNEVTIFRYFGSKDALLEEAVRLDSTTPLGGLLPEVPANPEAELTSWAEAVRDHLHSKRSLIRKCMGEMEERPEMMLCAKQAPVRSTNNLCKYFESLRKHGFTQEKVDPMVPAAMLMGTIFHDAMGREMMPEAMPKPQSKAVTQYVRLLLNGLGVKRKSSTQ
ncbi:MAG: TetR/AcrR family transcriptional regulator [Gemmatimonadaceae bacterium]|nr:TetR/AcrR family transcriptional regulator [Gemmatimonadaceae bacterium]